MSAQHKHIPLHIQPPPEDDSIGVTSVLREGNGNARGRDLERQRERHVVFVHPPDATPAYASMTEPDFIVQAIRENYGRDVDSKVWLFARMCKRYYPTSIDLDAICSATERVLARHRTSWQHAFGVTEEEFTDSMEEVWEEISLADGSPLDLACKYGEEFPKGLVPRVGRSAATHGFDRFITLAFWLQIVAKNGNDIHLPTRTVAVRLGSDKSMVSIWTRKAVRLGFLRRTKKHKFNPDDTSKRRCARYRVTDFHEKWLYRSADAAGVPFDAPDK